MAGARHAADKVLALVKSLHQRPRSRLLPLPEYAQEFVAAEFAQGDPGRRAAAPRRERTSWRCSATTSSASS